MQSKSEQCRLRYTPEQVFDLIADVEQYPTFLPGWESVFVRRRSADSMDVEQRVWLGPFNMRFATRATLKRPHEIVIHAHEGAFKHLSLRWSFSDDNQSGCVVRLTVSWKHRSRWVETVLATLMQRMPGRIIDSFAARARERYGDIAHA